MGRIGSMMQERVDGGVWTPPGVDVALDKKLLKSLTRRYNGVSLLRAALCFGSLALLGIAYAASFGTWMFWPMLFLFGSATSLTVYSLSHECAHGTVFRARWLNETFFWLTSLLFGQEVLYRRYSHATHHTYTMYVGKDAQLPITQPAGALEYATWYSGVYYYAQFLKLLVLHSFGRFSEQTQRFVPSSELGRMRRNSRFFLVVYAIAAGGSLYAQSGFLLWFWLLPKLAGDPVMMAFAGSQHFEKQENTHDLRESTRSLRPNPIIDLFYWNMSYHIEHHMHPTVPYHALPKLNAQVRDNLPQTRGIVGATAEIVRLWRERTLRERAPAMRNG
jgi:fatty acid desaturase